MQENEKDERTVIESDTGETLSKCTARPTEVRYNDWRLVEMPKPETILPCIPVSVIVPYYERPEELARTLASLERQTYPRDLFEVVVVDDGSRTPLERPEKSLLNIKVVHQDDRGYGLARARNNGVREASHDILVFLDCDVLVEAGWLEAHARWHHFIEDAVTVGFNHHVAIEGVDPDTIKDWTGSLAELFSDRNPTPSWIETIMARTDDLTSYADDIFRVALGGNLGIRRTFFLLAGGSDESFTQWGGEDTEFGYRAYMHGGLLVPVRDAAGWHQGEWTEGREEKLRSYDRQRGKFADLIAHPTYRTRKPGRSYKVPTYVVTILVMDAPVERVVKAIEQVLAGTAYDLVVFADMAQEHADFDIVEHHFKSDPRVLIGASGTALDSFPTAPFHITIPAMVSLQRDVVRQLHDRLNRAVMVTALCDNGERVSIARTWALHRARRTGIRAEHFGEIVEIPANVLGLKVSRTIDNAAGSPSYMWRRAGESRLSADVRRLTAELKQVHSPSQAVQLSRMIVSALRRRLLLSPQRRSIRRSAPSQVSTPTNSWSEGGADYSLGAEFVVLGKRARAVFHASRRVAYALGGHHVDVVVADTSTEAPVVKHPTVVLSEAPIQYSVPAFDAWNDNPINWSSDAGKFVAALRPLEVLPSGIDVERIIDPNDRTALKQISRLEDVHALHQDVLSRAGELARLAANGVVVRLADSDPRLAEPLGAELFELMVRDSRTLDRGARELLSIRMRRAALRDHSLLSRARQICGAILTEPTRPPLVSILLVTRRPSFLPQAIDAVARQTYPRLELALALHGDGFEDCDQHLDKLNCQIKVLRLEESCLFGEVLNAAVHASSGSLLSKMDDDDLYDSDHIWDLVLAHEYSRASLVGKGSEYVYLAKSNRTVRRFTGGAEHYSNLIGGGAMLITRNELDRIGGWKPIPRWVDKALIEDVARAGGRVYRTHGCGYVLVRHGGKHAWEVDDDYFLRSADIQSIGWDPTLVDFNHALRPPSTDA